MLLFITIEMRLVAFNLKQKVVLVVVLYKTPYDHRYALNAKGG